MGRREAFLRGTWGTTCWGVRQIPQDLSFWKVDVDMAPGLRPGNSGGARGLGLWGEWGGGGGRAKKEDLNLSQANLSCPLEDGDKEACLEEGLRKVSWSVPLP